MTIDEVQQNLLKLVNTQRELTKQIDKGKVALSSLEHPLRVEFMENTKQKAWKEADNKFFQLVSDITEYYPGLAKKKGDLLRKKAEIEEELREINKVLFEGNGTCKQYTKAKVD